jgi:hypothetical protein
MRGLILRGLVCDAGPFGGDPIQLQNMAQPLDTCLL